MEAIYIFSFSDWCPTHHQHQHQAVISKIFCNLSKCNSRRTHLQQKCEQYWQSSQLFDCLWSCRNTKNFQNKSKLHGKSFPLTRNGFLAKGLIRFMRNHSCIFDALHFFSPWHQLLSYSKLDSSGVTVTAQNCSKVQSEFSELMSYWEESEWGQPAKKKQQPAVSFRIPLDDLGHWQSMAAALELYQCKRTRKSAVWSVEWKQAILSLKLFFSVKIRAGS